MYVITSDVVESWHYIISIARRIDSGRARRDDPRLRGTGRIQVHLASIIPDSTVVEDGTNICRSSHDCSPPCWEKRGLPFPRNYYGSRKERTSANDDQCRGTKGKEFFERIESKNRAIVVDANGTLKDEFADANARGFEIVA